MNKWLVLIVILALSVACKSENKEKPVEEDTAVTIVENTTSETFDFPIYDFDGLEPLLNREDGKTYVINFWATWCKPCIEELPYFEKVNAEMKAKGVEVVLVSLDMPKMWKTHLAPFISRKNLKSQVVVLDDPKQNTWIPKIDKDWSGAIPATIIYNKKKRSFYEQSFTYEMLEETINEFLN